MAELQLSLFGGFELRSPTGADSAPTARKARALLAYLAVTAGRRHSRDKLAALLWGESPESAARTSLRQALTTIRRSIQSESDGAIVADGETIAFRPEAAAIDVLEFENFVADGSRLALQHAVDLYRGDLLEGFHSRAPAYEDWLRAERERLRRAAMEAMRTLLDGAQNDGATPKALELASRLVATDPLQEDAHRRLMRLYARCGRDADALRQYRQCQAILRRELGVAPDKETQELYRDLLHSRRRRTSTPADRLSQVGAAAPPPEGDSPIVEPEPVVARDDSALSNRVPREPELRQATILFVDLSGFTALSAALDPESVHQLLNTFLESVDTIIRQHGGTVDKHIGDGVMAVFGVPTAHGNDPERAVLTALAIHDAMPGLSETVGRQLRVHTGLASGQVLVSRTGWSTTVTGDAVNLASRLTELAGPGETLVSEAVGRTLAGRLEGAWTVDATIKGLPEQSRICRVIGLRARSDQRAPPALVGRSAEQHQFAGILAACRESGRGMTVYIRGEAGIGKTRLLSGFLEKAESEGYRCHKGLILDFGVTRGEDALATLARSMLGALSGGGTVAAATALEQAIADGVIDEERRGLLYELAQVPLPPEQGGLFSAMDRQARLRGMEDTICHLVRHAARQAPVLLAVEDVHWADERELGVFARLAAEMTECRAILLLTGRTGHDPLDRAWRTSAGEPAIVTIDLGPLRRDEASQLVDAFDWVDATLAERCIERSGGNPLFLEQLLRSGPSPDGVPDSVQGIVTARMDQLAPADRKALQAAAVLGQRFDTAALRHALDDPSYNCDVLLREVFVRREGDSYLFAHALVQDAVYASLLRSQRNVLHRRAAEWFKTRDLTVAAEHLDRGEDAAAPAAYLEAAHDHAAHYRFRLALRLVERGLEMAEDVGLKYELAWLRATLLRDLGRPDSAIAAFRQALDWATEPVHRCRAWIGIASGHRIKDETPEALEALESAEASLGEKQPADELSEIHYLRGNLYFPLGRINECLQSHQRASTFARRASSPIYEARARGGLGDAYYQRGHISAAEEEYARCVALSRDNGYTQIEVANQSMVGICRFYRLDLHGAIEDARAAYETAAKIGSQRAAMVAAGACGVFLTYCGRWDEAKVLTGRSHDLASQIGARRFTADNMCYLAIIEDALGRTEEAEALLDDSVRISLEVGASFTGPWVLGVLAKVTRDEKRRRWALAEGERLLGEGCVSHNYFHFYENAMEASLERGEWQEVERYAAALEVYTRDQPLSWADFFIARARVISAARRSERGAELAGELARLAEIARQGNFVVAATALDDALATVAG